MAVVVVPQAAAELAVERAHRIGLVLNAVITLSSAGLLDDVLGLFARVEVMASEARGAVHAARQTTGGPTA